ncbi:MAG: Flp family type IVb pilin [Deltaproteobacteria bacterium]|nr:Flp family type IVb pilin [Deltaproteobacteria bacterium]
MVKSTSVRNRRGQGLTEYIIIVALVAIAAIGIVNIFGNQLRNQFATIITAMSGSSQKQVKSLADKAHTETNLKSLSDYAASK